MTKPKDYVPTRGRGRPPGSKNRPKVLEYVQKWISDPLKAPPLGIGLHQCKPGAERSAYAQFLNAKRTHMKGENRCRVGRFIGTPRGQKEADYKWIRAKAEADAERMYKALEENTLLPEDDMAKFALLSALTVLKEPASHGHKIAAARLVLDFTKQKPATKTDVSVNAAEAFLKLLAEDDAKAVDALKTE